MAALNYNASLTKALIPNHQKFRKDWLGFAYFMEKVSKTDVNSS